MNNITINDKSYTVDEDGAIQNVNCCCHAESHLGHNYCSIPPEGFFEAEQEGLIFRQYDGTWIWFINL